MGMGCGTAAAWPGLRGSRDGFWIFGNLDFGGKLKDSGKDNMAGKDLFAPDFWREMYLFAPHHVPFTIHPLSTIVPSTQP